ncbi:MAG: hypothetical protein C0514_01470 [Candidatus Puniceispirillum sp.]|nr:hypothetical protein [Candidatus Puniceispirillum sp.]
MTRWRSLLQLGPLLFCFLPILVKATHGESWEVPPLSSPREVPRDGDILDFLQDLPFPQTLDPSTLESANYYIDQINQCVGAFSEVVLADEETAALCKTAFSADKQPDDASVDAVNKLFQTNEVLQTQLPLIQYRALLLLPGVCAKLPIKLRKCFSQEGQNFYAQMHTFNTHMRLYTASFALIGNVFSTLRRAVYFAPAWQEALHAFGRVQNEAQWLDRQVIAYRQSPKVQEPFSLARVNYVARLVFVHEGLEYFASIFQTPPLNRGIDLILDPDPRHALLTQVNNTLASPKLKPLMSDALWSISPHKNQTQHDAFVSWFIHADKLTIAKVSAQFTILAALMEQFNPLDELAALRFKCFFRTAAAHLEGRGRIIVMASQGHAPRATKKQTASSRGKHKARRRAR